MIKLVLMRKKVVFLLFFESFIQNDSRKGFRRGKNESIQREKRNFALVRKETGLENARRILVDNLAKLM